MNTPNTESQKPRFVGTLEKNPFLRIASFIALEGAAGALSLSAEQHVISIFYGAGAPIFVATNQPAVKIGTALVNAKQITPEKLQETLEGCKRLQMTVVQYLISHNIVPATTVFNELTKQAMARILTVARWDYGCYAFYDGMAPPRSMMPLNLKRYEVLRDITLNGYTAERAKRILARWENNILLPNPQSVISLKNDLGLADTDAAFIVEWIKAKKPINLIISEKGRLPSLLLLAISIGYCRLAPYQGDVSTLPQMSKLLEPTPLVKPPDVSHSEVIISDEEPEREPKAQARSYSMPSFAQKKQTPQAPPPQQPQTSQPKPPEASPPPQTPPTPRPAAPPMHPPPTPLAPEPKPEPPPQAGPLDFSIQPESESESPPPEPPPPSPPPAPPPQRPAAPAQPPPQQLAHPQQPPAMQFMQGNPLMGMGMMGMGGFGGATPGTVQTAPEPWPAKVPKSGPIKDIPLTEIMLYMYKAQLNGSLTVDNGKHAKTAYFFRGIPFHITGKPNIEQECLGQLLNKQGRIDNETLRISREIMEKENKKQGEILIEMGKLTQGELLAALKMQTETKMLNLFDLQNGSYEVKEGLPPDLRPMFLLNMGQVLYKATVKKGDAISIQKRMESLGVYPMKTKQSLFDRKNLKFGVKEIKLLDDCINGVRKMDEVLKVSPILRSQAVKTIYAFWLLGFIEMREGAETVGLAEKHKAELIEFKNGISTGTPFEVLGIHWSSYQEVTDVAHQKRRSRFMSGGTDYYPNEPESVKLASEIVKMIDDAYERIKTAPLRKKEREARIEPTMIKRTAELMLEKAFIMLDMRGNIKEALPFFKSLVEIQPEEGVNWAGLGFCLTFLGNARDGRAAFAKGESMAGNDYRVKKMAEKMK